MLARAVATAVLLCSCRAPASHADPSPAPASAPASVPASAPASAPVPASASASATASARAADKPGEPTSRSAILARFAGREPERWGQSLPGILTRIDTAERVLALTFDLCDGRGYDAEIVEFLVREGVDATLFVTGRWIQKNPALFRALAASPRFELENHGLKHKPASINGRAAYGIAGTRSLAELFDEVTVNEARIEQVTGRRPRYFRSGTAFYDDVAVSAIKALGEAPVGYSILGDAGGSMTAPQVKAALLKADPGSIALLHLNHPGSGTAGGVLAAVPELLRAGFRFVKLSDRRLRGSR